MITNKELLSIRSYHIMVCEISQIFVSLGIDTVLYCFRCCCIQCNRNNSKSLFHHCKPQSDLSETQACSHFPYYSLIAATSSYRKFLDWKISKGKGKPVPLVRRESGAWHKTMQRFLMEGKSPVVLQPLCIGKAQWRVHPRRACVHLMFL